MKLLGTITLLLSIASQVLSLEKIADWSSASILTNQRYYDIDGREAPLERILFNNGFTTVRQLHVVGQGVAHDHDSNLKLAKRAKAAGLKVYIDLSFRGGYNDPQTIGCNPAWGKTRDSIGRGIYHYTHSVATSFAANGIIPSYISLGNEIAHGVCESGNISLAGGLENTAYFLRQASLGVRDSALGSHTKLMLHLENGWQTETFEWFFGALEKAGLPSNAYHAAAMTAYPFYHSVNATQENFYRSIKTVQSKYKKEVLIVESSWPRSVWGKVTNGIPPDAQFPISVEGQERWIRLLATTAKRAGAAAIAYYEPAFLTNPNTGSQYANTLLFDDKGHALSSLATFKTV